jgi:hypothetical protein
MKTFTLASLFAAATAAAVPRANETNPNLYHFQLMSLRSASPIHFGQFNAADDRIFINHPSQGAECLKGDGNGPATFQLNKEDGTLFLYKVGNPRQELWVDRSGMGQGLVGYTSGAQGLPRNGEREGWEVNETGNLSFDGAELIACPSDIDGAYSVWVSAGVDQPGGNEGCLGLSARTIEVAEPDQCTYTNVV